MVEREMKNEQDENPHASAVEHYVQEQEEQYSPSPIRANFNHLAMAICVLSTSICIGAAKAVFDMATEAKARAEAGEKGSDDKFAAEFMKEPEDYGQHPTYLAYIQEFTEFQEKLTSLTDRYKQISQQELDNLDLKGLDLIISESRDEVGKINSAVSQFNGDYRAFLRGASPQLAQLIQRKYEELSRPISGLEAANTNFVVMATRSYNRFVKTVDDENFDAEVLGKKGFTVLLISDDTKKECRNATFLIAHFKKEESAEIAIKKVALDPSFVNNVKILNYLQTEGVEQESLPLFVAVYRGKVIASSSEIYEENKLIEFINWAINLTKEKPGKSSKYKKNQEPPKSKIITI